MTSLRQCLSDAPQMQRRVGKQANKLLAFLKEQNGQSFEPAHVLAHRVASIICGVAFGEDYDTSNVDMNQILVLHNEALKDGTDIQVLSVFDLFPFVEYLPIPAYKRLMEKALKIFSIIRRLLREREQDFQRTDPVRDLIAGLLKAKEEAKQSNASDVLNLLSEDHLVLAIEDMFIGGYETTRSTLEWALAYLTNFPQYQTEIQRELDEMVGQDRRPTLADRPNLPFIQATILEVVRLGNVAPQAIPHTTLTDTVLCGYRVPKDTYIILDTEAVHLDPNCWEKPKLFNPYRHIDSAGKLIPNPKHFYPFGAGRRVCPGESVAKSVIFLLLSCMLQKFTFLPEEGCAPPELRGLVGLTQVPAPYKIRAVERL